MRKSTLAPGDDALTHQIIGAAISVHKALGPGLIEIIYRNALGVVLDRLGIRYQREHRCAMFFEGVPIGEQRLDLVVEGRVVVELKAVESLAQIHRAQLLTYLRATNLQIGLLVNFGSELIQVKRALHTPKDRLPSLRPLAPSS